MDVWDDLDVDGFILDAGEHAFQLGPLLAAEADQHPLRPRVAERTLGVVEMTEHRLAGDGGQLGSRGDQDTRDSPAELGKPGYALDKQLQRAFVSHEQDVAGR